MSYDLDKLEMHHEDCDIDVIMDALPAMIRELRELQKQNQALLDAQTRHLYELHEAVGEDWHKTTSLSDLVAVARVHAADLREARELLREVEWRGYGDCWTDNCPLCGESKPDHDEDCRLGKWLERRG